MMSFTRSRETKLWYWPILITLLKIGNILFGHQNGTRTTKVGWERKSLALPLGFWSWIMSVSDRIKQPSIYVFCGILSGHLHKVTCRNATYSVQILEKLERNSKSAKNAFVVSIILEGSNLRKRGCWS